MRAHSICSEASRLHSFPGAATDCTIARQLLPKSEARNRPRAALGGCPTLGPGRTRKRGGNTIGVVRRRKASARPVEPPPRKHRSGRWAVTHLSPRAGRTAPRAGFALCIGKPVRRRCPS